MCWKQRAARGCCALSVAIWSSAAFGIDPPAQVGIDPPPQVVSIDQLPLRSHLDLGEHPPDKPIRVALTLRSKLGKRLTILSIEPDCGCLDVKHDEKGVADDGSQSIQLQLAPSRKLGRIRRKLRIFFEQERTSPLEIGIDTRIVGPLKFASSSFAVRNADQMLELHGQKQSELVEIVSCMPTRGTCRVVSLEQTANDFKIIVDPIVAFGRADELFRVRYREPGDTDSRLLELPVELECVAPLRFLPSVTPIRYEEDSWRAEAKFVVTPQTKIDLKSLQLSIECDQGRSLEDSEFRVNLSQTSVVLHSMQIRCTTENRPLNRPARLHVAGPNGEPLATLVFLHP